jgi:hypothetical protein
MGGYGEPHYGKYRGIVERRDVGMRGQSASVVPGTPLRGG